MSEPDAPVLHPNLWPVPRRTGNSLMLTGALAATIGDLQSGPYHVDSLSRDGILVRNEESGNLYLVTALQISGEE